jgi:hypothetical protein
MGDTYGRLKLESFAGYNEDSMNDCASRSVVPRFAIATWPRTVPLHR